MLILSMLFGAFRLPSPRTGFFLPYALDGHGYIFSCTVIIFHDETSHPTDHYTSKFRAWSRARRNVSTMSPVG